MRVKTIVDEDFTNYKKPAMFIGTVSCDGKCCKEAGIPMSVCQNDEWRESATIYISNNQICERYVRNPITKAMVFGGLEPFEQFEEVFNVIGKLRAEYNCNDDVVIYTGYNRDEISNKVDALDLFGNVIVKFGRYIPNRPTRYDEVLGVTLASDNQYAERV